MQSLYKDESLYFRVLPRDFALGYLRKFCISYRYMHSIRVGETVSHVTFDLDGNAVVTLYGCNEVRVYSCTSGELLRNISSLEDPMCCSVSKTGCFYVVEDDWVGEYSPTGEELRSIGEMEDYSPCSLAVLKDQLWVCYNTFLTVYHIGSEAILYESNFFPWGPMTTIGDDQIAILSAQRIYIFDTKFTVVREFSIGNHDYSHGFAFDSQNEILLVVDLEDKCILYDLYGDYLGKLDFYFREPTGVAATEILCVADKGCLHLFQ